VDAAGAGRATLTIIWPDRGRLVPLAANSIVATFALNGVTVQSQTVARPPAGGASTVTFQQLKVGALQFTASAHPGADGSGTAQARGSASITIVAGQVAQVALTMQSTIDRLELSPTAPQVAVGGTLQITASARDASNAIVLTSPSKIAWDTGDHSVATVSSTGLVTGVAVGTTTVTVTDSESGKSRSASLDCLSSDLVEDRSTGHWYLGVRLPSLITWRAARDAAAGMRFRGMTGHLATLTTATENAFVSQQFVGDARLSFFFGAYQDRAAADYSEPRGGWRWITGEPWAYTDWGSREPNNLGGIEDYVNLFPTGHWNDCPNDDGHGYGYIVEFEP
jgi:hypothetical protein